MRSNFGFVLFTLGMIFTFAGCSDTKKNLDSGTFFVTSDCVSPTLSGTVQVIGNTVISGDNYLSYGFPTQVVRAGEDNVGASRLCKNTYGDTSGGADFVFSCFDRLTDTYQCTIHIQVK